MGRITVPSATYERWLDMNLLQLCQLYWWSINDSATNPILMDKTTLTTLINDARNELARSLKMQSSSTLTASPADKSIYTVPTDFAEFVMLKFGDNKLVPIDDISYLETDLNDADDNSTEVKYFTFLNPSTIQIFDTPADTDTTALKLWYVKYPTALVSDIDVPSEIPPEYHKHLVLTYAKSIHEFRMGRYAAYQQLSLLWEEIKKEIGGELVARYKPVEHDDGRYVF